jgi:prepilin-type N-terminal cleavage/methylation domain-containing protein
MLNQKSNQGFTLIETIVTIAIIAIAMTGIIAVWSNAVNHSADPFWQSKTATLGSIYLNQAKRLPTNKIKGYQGPIIDLNGKVIDGYPEYKVNIQTQFAADDFLLNASPIAAKSLKKISITLSHPQAVDQVFVLYKQVSARRQ